jgi:hypothetical protein
MEEPRTDGTRDHCTNLSREVSSAGDAAPPQEGAMNRRQKRPELGWKYRSSLAAPCRGGGGSTTVLVYALGDPCNGLGGDGPRGALGLASEPLMKGLGQHIGQKSEVCREGLFTIV